MTAAVTRYHPLLVALHWIVALMIALSLVGGLSLMQTTPNSDPMKPIYIRSHMMGGLALGVLMLARLATRLMSAKPAPVVPGWQARLAKTVHWALYLLIFAMLSTGIGMAALAGLFPLLAGEAVTLPASFESLPPHAGHELFARLLIGLIGFHVLAAVWHAFSAEDIWGRMWFGKRTG